MKKEKTTTEWSELDIDLMFWHYCVGIQQSGIDAGQANNLCAERWKHLFKMFKKAPSFAVVLKADDGRLTMEKKTIDQANHYAQYTP